MDRDFALEKTKPSIPLKGEALERLKLVEDKTEKDRFLVGAALLRRQERWGSGWKDEKGANQDAVLIDAERGLFGVFDGVGGLEQGAEASAAARDALSKSVPKELERIFYISPGIQKQFTEKEGEGGTAERLQLLYNFVKDDLGIEPLRLASEKDWERALKQGLITAQTEVLEKAPEGGTTASLMGICEDYDGKKKGTIINRGDSRIYVYRQGKITQLTRDDTGIQLLLEKGLIADDEDILAELSDPARECLGKITGQYAAKGERIRDLRHVITAGLYAGERVEKTQIVNASLENGDLVLAVTDGVADNLTRRRIEEIIGQGKPDAKTADLIAGDIAKEARIMAQKGLPRSKPDDIAVVAARIQRTASLRQVFEEHYLQAEKIVNSIISNNALVNLTLDLGAVRNQAEFALESNPDNEKLSALRDHIVEILHLVGDRQAELTRESEMEQAQTIEQPIKTIPVRPKKPEKKRPPDRAQEIGAI